VNYPRMSANQIPVKMEESVRNWLQDTIAIVSPEQRANTANQILMSVSPTPAFMATAQMAWVNTNASASMDTPVKTVTLTLMNAKILPVFMVASVLT
jgi:hypothetical protein